MMPSEWKEIIFVQNSYFLQSWKYVNNKFERAKKKGTASQNSLSSNLKTEEINEYYLRILSKEKSKDAWLFLKNSLIKSKILHIMS